MIHRASALDLAVQALGASRGGDRRVVLSIGHVLPSLWPRPWSDSGSRFNLPI
ncbi:hypothetical protein ARTSIC4J27_344 [Pseudarthrobacter siccitolerans]|uniref:Uncharacterized protein n=1 Tax=Pseudarthrobacter siccitolerans TaxID=861266 RepID=A0A024GXE4_9MICC|nr:hypothetical protein ARTSIC4J27_344 [Pseudarthrobacter siccitolerans]